MNAVILSVTPHHCVTSVFDGISDEVGNHNGDDFKISPYRGIGKFECDISFSFICQRTKVLDNFPDHVRNINDSRVIR